MFWGLIVTLLACILIQKAWGGEPVLRINCSDWPPYVDSGMAQGGVATEIVREAFRREGLTTELHTYPWARALFNTRHLIDDASICAWRSTEREKEFLYSAPILVNRLIFVKRKSLRIHWRTLMDLRPYTFAVERGSVHEAAFDAAEYLQKYEVADKIKALKMVLIGRADLTPLDEGLAHHILATQFHDKQDNVDFLMPPLSELTLHIIVSKKHRQGQRIVDLFNAGLADMRRDGSYLDILERAHMDGIKYPPQG